MPSVHALAKIALMAWVLWSPAFAAETAVELQQSYDELVEEFAGRVSRPASPSTGMLVFVVPDQYAAETARGNISPAQIEYADCLFALAQRAAESGEASRAFSWATEAVCMHPEHAKARRVLGYEKFGDDWRTTFAERMADRGFTWHPNFGWLLADDISRYEAGQRKDGDNWISAAADAKRHETIGGGWPVRTDHFLVTTNHSLEAGVELAAKLERLHQVWRQLFASFFLTDRQVRQLFAGERNPRQRSKPFRVFYHREKQDYIELLVRRQPQIGATLGIYFDTHREAHFYATTDDSSPTLYHEAVHQLFQETRKAARNIGTAANFWVIEGIALYFESLTAHDDAQLGSYFTIGAADAGRVPAARQRVLDNEFLMPTAELVRLGKLDLQRHAQIAALYSQSAALATLLMHGRNGSYREPLIRYLQVVYAGRDNAETLSELTGQSYAELDRASRKFVKRGM